MGKALWVRGETNLAGDEVLGNDISEIVIMPFYKAGPSRDMSVRPGRYWAE